MSHKAPGLTVPCKLDPSDGLSLVKVPLCWMALTGNHNSTTLGMVAKNLFLLATPE